MLGALISANFANWHLLYCNLPPNSVVHANVDIAEGTMTNHLAEFPFSDWFRFGNVFIKSLWVFFGIVLDLLGTKVAILVVVVKIILILLVVAVADLTLMKG